MQPGTKRLDTEDKQPLNKSQPATRKHTRLKLPFASMHMTAYKINHESTKELKHERKLKFSCFRGGISIAPKSAKIT